MTPALALRVSASLLFSSFLLMPASPLHAAAKPPPPGEGASSPFNHPDDGGASAYSGPPIVQKESMASAEQRERFPIGQRSRLYVLGGGVRGIGMLAKYDRKRPERVLVARRTSPGEHEPLTPIALASVFDPEGNCVAVENFTDQPSGVEVREIPIPSGRPGIWRVSFSGGRRGDVVEIRLPGTSVWGVRGEMSLTFDGDTPRPAYLWLPPGGGEVMVGLESGSRDGVRLETEVGNALAEPTDDPAGRAGRLVAEAPGSVCRLVTPDGFEGAVTVEGAPGLFCPSAEAARQLQGGMIRSGERWVAGPLQARAREWMLANVPRLESEPKFEFPKQIPADLEHPEVHVLAFQKYGPLNTLGAQIRVQNRNLDPQSPYFCTNFEPKEGEPPRWVHLRPERLAGPFQAGDFAAAAGFESPVNPAFRSAEIVRRATLAAFAHVSNMQGDDLLRENDLFKGRYPVTHCFFIYSNLALAYEEIHGQLEPEARAIWREAVLAIGDKLADHQAYESNQWAHVMEGHLYVYLATGEARFRRFFERTMTAYLDNTYGPASKFGQHPAGYFLEEFGPDGNYDKLNSFVVSAVYEAYRAIPDADDVLVKKLHQAIERNLRFTSFFWLPQPDGEVLSPTAINCRTTGPIGAPGFPGQFLPKAHFPLAAARFALTPDPGTGIGPAGTFSFLANNEAWIRRTLADGLRKGADGYSGGSGTWLPVLRRAYSQPSEADPAAIPVRESDKEWELPGLRAFNRGGIYGVVFYDVTGATQTLKGITGGGPTALWSPATGMFIASMQAAAPAESLRITDPAALTFACVYGKDEDGGFFHSGKERAEAQAQEGGGFVVTSRLEKRLASLAWKYEPGGDGLGLAVRFKSLKPLREARLNLPVFNRIPGVKIELEKPNRLVFRTAGGGIAIQWPENAPGELSDSALPTVRRLIIPIPYDGSDLRLSITPLSTPSTTAYR